MEHTQTPDSAVKNSKSRDNGAKLIFSDPILCAEFLRGYRGYLRTISSYVAGRP